MIFRILLYVGLGMLIPGIVSLGTALAYGPSSWLTDARTFWGTPIALFVFWIGLAHAGTLISAIFLALGIHLDRRTSMLAELSTLCALVVAAVFPLMHLGLPENFYMAIPFLDGRGNFANVRSPLVWDFCCIAIYAILSTVFLIIHLYSEKKESIEKLRKPMAWVLFPLVLWVHTIVSLDFAVTFVPEWRGAFFPLYFICGAIYSGLAVVILLLSAENSRVRLLEKMMMVGSWFMFGFWVWNFALKGDWSVGVFVFGALLPQLWWESTFRESTAGRCFVAGSVVLGLWLERIILVVPSLFESSEVSFGMMDIGLMSFALGLFLVLFVCLRFKLRRFIESDGISIGEISQDSEITQRNLSLPLESKDLKVLRFPMLMGVLVTLIYVLWLAKQLPYVDISLVIPNVAPLCYPIVALIASVVFCGPTFWKESTVFLKRFFVLALAVAGVLFGMFWAGGQSIAQNGETAVQRIGESVSPMELWNSRCASCHGSDGNFNKKFVREFYPIPQKLDMLRLDSIGEDSLVQVIMHGRANMNAYGGRLSVEEAHQLVKYMQSLASKGEKP